jgi:signal transduction histidine kinase
LKLTVTLPPEKEIILRWDQGPPLPTVTTDRVKLEQILKNLLHNAVKFTERGSVTLTARYDERDKIVEFRVTDTGIGIPRQAISGIFEMFRQGDSSETRAFGGVGLGLYIVKRFTELLGGTVAVESTPGRGSVFIVKIPADEAS